MSLFSLAAKLGSFSLVKAVRGGMSRAAQMGPGRAVLIRGVTVSLPVAQ